MRTLIISVIILIFSNCYSQENEEEFSRRNLKVNSSYVFFINKDSNQFKSNSIDVINRDFIKINTINDWNIDNFPFQFGLELGLSPRIISKDNFVNIGVLGSMDINLYKRLIFIKFELGRMNINDNIELKGADYSRTVTYGSLGLNYKILKFGKKNSIFLSLGAGAVTQGEFPFLLFSLKYVYIIDRFIGVTTSIKYPFIHSNNPFIGIGFQFFNN